MSSFFQKNRRRLQKGSLRAFCSPWGIWACLDHAARKVGEPQFRRGGGKEGHQEQCECTQAKLFFIFFGRCNKSQPNMSMAHAVMAYI